MSRAFLLLTALVSAAVLAVLVVGGLRGDSTPAGGAADASPDGAAAMVAVSVPELSGDALTGRDLFRDKCSACHGADAAGREGVGPPLVHKIYEPGHHGDGAFQLAALQGVRAHHWPFGNMPPVEGITPAEVDRIIAYVRALQRANGIN